MRPDQRQITAARRAKPVIPLIRRPRQPDGVELSDTETNHESEQAQKQQGNLHLFRWMTHEDLIAQSGFKAIGKGCCKGAQDKTPFFEPSRLYPGVIPENSPTF